MGPLDKTTVRTIDKGSIKSNEAPIWWENVLLFPLVHVAAIIGMYYYPAWTTHRENLILAFSAWFFTGIGITMGYHRLYSHKSFRASFAVRFVLAMLGAGAFQGSVKWWTLRHRLHHRFTDDPIHDPYAATRGMVWAHVGWVFYRPRYERMELIERDDLDNDPVVVFQHKYYLPISVFFALVLPTLIGLLWGDPMGAWIWGGLVARLWTWQCTFLVNSLAHYDGLQPYSDENTSRGNLLVALLTWGEGNHNFHAFPHDFRAGPSVMEWDPSKWIILALHKLGLITGLRRVNKEDMVEALQHMEKKQAGKPDVEDNSWQGEVWTMKQVEDFSSAKPASCLIIMDGYVIDASSYLGEHPGGAAMLRRYSFGTTKNEDLWRSAEWAFHGGLNNHSRAARKRMNQLRVAKLAVTTN